MEDTFESQISVLQDECEREKLVNQVLQKHISTVTDAFKRYKKRYNNTNKDSKSSSTSDDKEIELTISTNANTNSNTNKGVMSTPTHTHPHTHQDFVVQQLENKNNEIYIALKGLESVVHDYQGFVYLYLVVVF